MAEKDAAALQDILNPVFFSQFLDWGNAATPNVREFFEKETTGKMDHGC
jgi:hypothetical protein